MRVAAFEIPAGEPGTRQTIDLMRAYARQAATDGEFRAFCLGLVDPVQPHDAQGEIETAYQFVRDRITYRRDPHGVEWVQHPFITLATATGDCDDQVTLLAAILLCLGHPAAAVTVGRYPGRYEHVFLQTRNGLVLDPIASFAPGSTYPAVLGAKAGRLWEF